MSKISLLPLLATADVDGTVTVPVIKDGTNRRAPLLSLIAALAQPFVDLAQKWANGTAPGGAGTKSAREYSLDSAGYAAAAGVAVGTVNLTTQTTIDIVDTDQDTNGRWWSQRRADGTLRVQKLCDARGNRLDLKITSNTTRIAAAEISLTAASAKVDSLDTALSLSTQATNDVAGADIDARYRSWIQYRANGTIRVQGIEDRWGNRLDLIVASNTARLKALEDTAGVPRNIKRLQRGYYDAPKIVPAAAAGQFVSLVGDDTAANLIANAVPYAKESPFIRRLGGPWVQASTTYPGNAMMAQQNVVYLTVSGAIGGNPQVEIVIDAGVTQIEWKGTGCAYVGLMIDGKLTATTGHVPAPAISSGGYRSHLLTLAASTSARRIRLIFQRNSQVGEFRVNAGGRLLDPTPSRGWTIYVIGDSITEGSNATRNALTCWLTRFGMKIGADQIANGGVGGTGWARSISSGDAAAARLPVILNMVNGAPPDALVCALGINDFYATQADLDAITAAVTAFLTTVRAAAPYMPVIVLGPFGGYGGWGAQQVKQDTIFAAASQFPHVYTVDTGSWWSTPAEYQPWYDPATDTTHPIDTGHEAISQKVFNAVYAILKGL